ncbi:MAG: hypothetical protein IPL83_16600 [Bdellovibrionales bacterium]|nr:hypothetical protein [Bdellovibrionales bacterium]
MSQIKACVFLLYIFIMPNSFILVAPLAEAGTIGRAPAILDRDQNTNGAYAALTLQQLGLLDHRSRIQYIELMRETLLELEKVQGAFQFEVAQNSRGQSEFYALIFGLDVFAADKSKFYRNLNKEVTDEGCIYGGHFSQYATTASAYGCIRPPCTKKFSKNGKVITLKERILAKLMFNAVLLLSGLKCASLQELLPLRSAIRRLVTLKKVTSLRSTPF